MITKDIFPPAERRDLKNISANRKMVDAQMYYKCLAALEWAEDYINNGGLVNQSAKFMDVLPVPPQEA